MLQLVDKATNCPALHAGDTSLQSLPPLPDRASLPPSPEHDIIAPLSVADRFRPVLCATAACSAAGPSGPGCGLAQPGARPMGPSDAMAAVAVCPHGFVTRRPEKGDEERSGAEARQG